MKKFTKRASIFVYILLLINISLMLAYIVYNNTFIINNNLNIGKNNKEIYSFIYDKGHINLEADKKYNTDGSGFYDLIACPTDITMSGSTYSGIVDSHMAYDKGEIYCSGTYLLENFRLYFNEINSSTFKQAYFTGSTAYIKYDSSSLNYTSSGTFVYDDTKMTFASGSTLDNIDDDFNSDDYKPSSTGSISYPDGFQDNDDDARKTIFGNVSALSNLYNIFWNNFKTNDFIEKNTNNSGVINLNIGSSTGSYLYLDLYAFSGGLKYDLKILEFDRDSYKNKYTLLPKASYIGKNLISNTGYIGNSGSLLLETTTGSNSFVFDFKNKDYAIFITNKQDENLSYRITGIDKNTSKKLYINPIDDSGPTIKSLSNHMLIGDERNFIGEHITVVGSK